MKRKTTTKTRKAPARKAKATKAKSKAPAHDDLGKHPPFRIIRQKRRVFGEIQETVHLQFCHYELSDTLREVSQESEFYSPTPTVEASMIFHLLPTLEARITDDTPELKALVKWLNAEFERTKARLENLLKEGLITFDLLWYIFKKNDDVYAEHMNEKEGGRIKNIKYLWGWGGRRFVIEVQQVVSDGRHFRVEDNEFTIRDFDKPRKITELQVKPLDAKTRIELEDRGRKYADIANKATYLEYDTHMIWRTWFGPQYYRAQGRCMIDQNSFKRINPQYSENPKETEGTELDAVPQEMLFACSAYVRGFSFASKRWGEFAIKHLSPVRFNEEAFDLLVLEPKTKKLIRSLVENAGHTFQDIIYGKGGGVIFLLHGDPGTGKTLTAESIAEIRHRPLYSVSVGELGTDPIKLEENLRQILEMATVWNAVVLIDEADIFLEARTDDSDIQRNAMVGVFLRLLEYHQGILFLTTNRVRSFDKAFHSRISLAIKYPSLGESERRQIWKNLLHAAGVGGMQLDRLAAHVVNGRQIKTAIRLAQALAKADGGVVSMELLEMPIHHAEEFLENLGRESLTELGDPIAVVRPRRRNNRPSFALASSEPD